MALENKDAKFQFNKHGWQQKRNNLNLCYSVQFYSEVVNMYFLFIAELHM